MARNRDRKRAKALRKRALRSSSDARCVYSSESKRERKKRAKRNRLKKRQETINRGRKNWKKGRVIPYPGNATDQAELMVAGGDVVVR